MSRRSDEPRPAVEFVPSSTDGTDVTGDVTTTGRRRSHRLDLAFAAVVLSVGALMTRGIGHDPAPSPASSSAASASASVVAPTPVTAPAARYRDPAHCPGAGLCVVTATVPPAVTAAVRAQLAGARIGPVSTVRIDGNALWFRRITATVGPLHLYVQIQRPMSIAGSWTVNVRDVDSHISFVRMQTDGFVVQIQVDGPASELPSTAQLDALAADARLVQLS